MGVDDTDRNELEVFSMNEDGDVFMEVEITSDECEPPQLDDIVQPANDEETFTVSVATSTPCEFHDQLNLLVREVKALKERLADLMNRVQERIVEESLDADSDGIDPGVLVSSQPRPRNSQPSNNSAAKRKSTISKYAKKRRTMIPGGVTRIPRSLNERPTVTTVGKLESSFVPYDDHTYFQ